MDRRRSCCLIRHSFVGCIHPSVDEPHLEEGTQVLKPGIYVAEDGDSFLDYYKITMGVKETKKSYIFRLIGMVSANKGGGNVNGRIQGQAA